MPCAMLWRRCHVASAIAAERGTPRAMRAMICLEGGRCYYADGRRYARYAFILLRKDAVTGA